jgi:hypothetical protein
MITVSIGASTREWNSARDVEPSWINEQIRLRRADGQPVCFQIGIHAPPIELSLPVGQCRRNGGGGRPLRPQEQPVINLWKRRGLDKEDVQTGSLVSFLNQVFDLLS